MGESANKKNKKSSTVKVVQHSIDLFVDRCIISIFYVVPLEGKMFLFIYPQNF